MFTKQWYLQCFWLYQNLKDWNKWYIYIYIHLVQPLPEVGPPITNIYQYVSTVYYIFTETYHVFCFHLFWISWFSEPTSKTSTKSSGNTVDTWERGNRSNISSIHGLVFWFSAKTSGKCRRIACFLKSGYLITPSFFQEKEFVRPKKSSSLKIEAWYSWMTPSNHPPRYVKFTGQEWNTFRLFCPKLLSRLSLCLRFTHD